MSWEIINIFPVELDFKNNKPTKQESHQEYCCFLDEQFYLFNRKGAKILYLLPIGENKIVHQEKLKYSWWHSCFVVLLFLKSLNARINVLQFYSKLNNFELFIFRTIVWRLCLNTKIEIIYLLVFWKLHILVFSHFSLFSYKK